MAVVIYDVALYSVTPNSKIYSCPWRQHLSSLNVEWKDLNYTGSPTDNLQGVIDSLNSWDLRDEPLTVDSYPFLVYQKADSSINGGFPTAIIRDTLQSLLDDEDLKNYEP